MTSRIALLALALGFLAAPAWAQGPYVPPNPNPTNPYSRPTFSPYLNLYRSNNPGIAAGINYVGVTRPEFQLYGDVNQLQRQATALQGGAPGAGEGSELPVTGHPAAFQNLSHYFPGGNSSNLPSRKPGTGGGKTSSAQSGLPTPGAGAPKK